MKCSYNVNGVLLIDKSKGISSNYLLQQVKKIFRAKKAGHTGSLDPLATGMLPICFGESTKFSKYLLNAKKRYIVIAQLGIKTTTSDAEGEIIKISPVYITKEKLNNTLKKFLGHITQKPSMYSAIKYQGLSLYKYARKGITIDRDTRKITIYELNCIIYHKKFIKLEVYCSKGTYIRTLIDDLGEQLGCGAHVVFLRRLQVGLYKMHNLVTFNKLIDIKKKFNQNYFLFPQYLSKLNLLHPIDSPVSCFSKIKLTDFESKILISGQSIQLNSIPVSPNKIVRIMNNLSKLFIGIGKINKYGVLTPIRLISQ
ncbi:tRNA pseudouridine synthase B [Buchnera aphidicola (Eriosoma grossulariae)]|uniref:tRNA pseudouridine(55) synthase TruB n=1 Tax=Buchnera aphidicola TaxID=9 RepID=UPI00346447C7